MGKGAVMQADRDGHAGSGRPGEKRGRRDRRIKGRWTEREGERTANNKPPERKQCRGREGDLKRAKEIKEEWQTIKKLNKNQEVRQTYCHSSTPTEHTHLSPSNFYTNPINQTQTQSSLTLMRLTNPLCVPSCLTPSTPKRNSCHLIAR